MDSYSGFLNTHNYDVRLSRDARWIDQKCTYDVLSIVADCIIEFMAGREVVFFTVKDIWFSEYTRENVTEIFSKPDPTKTAKREYDKYFGQPIKLLSYSGILKCEKRGNTNYFSISEQKILEEIALRPRKALDFLCEYIEKVLNDSGLYDLFSSFFEMQTKDMYKKLRDEFYEFTKKNTNINNDNECGRIFTKILNPLAYKNKCKGTEGGHISKRVITLNDLPYNRPNWRDELSGKEKSVTRVEFAASTKETKVIANTKYSINKAKKALKKHNDKYYNGVSEVVQSSEVVKATQAHHIFSQSEYPVLADYVENLIMLTPNQHYSMAHPDNNTSYIDRYFQHVCLIAKTSNIIDDLFSDRSSKFYSLEDYGFVLNTGLNTTEFSNLNATSILTLCDKFDEFYDTENQTYSVLREENKSRYSV